MRSYISTSLLTLALICWQTLAWAQLNAGPMLGHVEMRTAQVWAQTKGPAKVQLRYWPKGKTTEARTTDAKLTQAPNAFTCKLIASELEPGLAYDYEVLVDGKAVKRPYPTTFTTQALWQHRTDPPTFSIALGSCYYHPEPAVDRPGSPYGDSLQIFSAIAAKKPEVMLWLGDNFYSREVDFGSREGMYRRATLARAEPQLQPLLASAANYAIWDDHDYGPNDADRSWAGKQWAFDIFQDFWANPTLNATGQGGITGTALWHDVQLFLLDDRWFRSPNADHNTGRPRDYLGQAQLNWLVDALIYSKAKFKLVAIGGQVLNPMGVHENYATYGQEREQLLRLITAAKVPGVVFLSGDRHHTEVIKLDRPGAYPLYDFTVSPLTSGVAKPGKEETDAATGRLPKTLVNQRNFATLTFSGTSKERTMTMRCFNVQGTQLWEHTLKADELK